MSDLLFDQNDADFEPSTQTAEAEDKRLRWNNLEAALMLLSCSFNSELVSPSEGVVVYSYCGPNVYLHRTS